ncbi:hypothetical protein EXN66_Car007951 [Channa argus]|uniref:Uncharacterized protein n=1 Tax=Channa argus TaxID=215402 RepID=A0A6G1PPS3_CHAAH|nr:hypothetical protein EXN66_Car007951 [Channa argus]
MGTEVMSTVDKCPGETPPKADGEEAACSRHFFWAACLLTLVSISFFIYIRVVVHKQENLQLIALQAEMDRLNSTLGSILKFDTFPVRAYCPQKSKCLMVQYGNIISFAGIYSQTPFLGTVWPDNSAG